MIIRKHIQSKNFFHMLWWCLLFAFEEKIAQSCNTSENNKIENVD